MKNGAVEWVGDYIWQYEKGELDSRLSEAGFTIASFDYAPGVSGRHLCYCFKRIQSS